MNGRRFLVVVALLSLQPLLGSAAENLDIENGDFKQWEQESPVDWAIDIAARSGTARPSQLKPLEDGGIELSGDAGTGEWSPLAQSIAVLRAQCR